jgi:hypothetical protein
VPNISDDIIFGSTNHDFCEEFSRIMTKRFEMSMRGELKFFFGFQINQLKEETFISQTKYTHDMLKKLIWQMQSLSTLPCQPMDILISMRRESCRYQGISFHDRLSTLFMRI